jgi:hypothetical protein
VGDNIGQTPTWSGGQAKEEGVGDAWANNIDVQSFWRRSKRPIAKPKESGRKQLRDYLMGRQMVVWVKTVWE